MVDLDLVWLLDRDVAISFSVVGVPPIGVCVTSLVALTVSIVEDDPVSESE